MNHDYAHCADFKDSCPEDCFRAQLVRDLQRYGDMKGFPVSWMHLEGTEACRKYIKEKKMILIAMEKPRECTECPFCDENADCVAVPDSEQKDSLSEQYANCPLKEVQQ